MGQGRIRTSRKKYKTKHPTPTRNGVAAGGEWWTRGARDSKQVTMGKAAEAHGTEAGENGGHGKKSGPKKKEKNASRYRASWEIKICCRPAKQKQTLRDEERRGGENIT